MKTHRYSLVGNVLCLSFLVGVAACSSTDNTDNTGAGGSTNTGGTKATGGSNSTGTGGNANTGGSATGGSGSGTGGSGTGGSSNTGGSGSGTGGGGGSSTGGTTGDDAGSGTGGAGPSTGGSGGGSDASTGDTGTPPAGAVTIKVEGLEMSPRFDAPVFPKSASNPENMSPAISWTGMPAGTMSFAVSMIDTGTTNGMKVTQGNGTKAHFVYFDIPVTATKLPANLPHTTTLTDPAGTKTTKFAGGTGYFGPGAGSVNIYAITVWALKVPTLGAAAGATSASVYGMLNAQSLGKATFIAVGKQGGL